ncbi:hypothetical protein Tco_0207722 [Tanacetum coccineum]
MQTDNKVIRTEVDEEQQTDTDSAERSEQSTELHKYEDEREQIRQVHNTESHKYGDEREQIRQTTADNRSR